MDQLFIVPAVLVFAAVALGTVSIVLVIDSIAASRRRREILRRLEPVDAGSADPLTDVLVRDNVDTPRGGLTTLLSQLPRARDVAALIRHSGTDWTVARYIVLTVGSGVAFGVSTLFLTLNPLLGAVAAVSGALLPDIYLRRKARNRLARFEEQFPEAMDLLGRAIRAGHPLYAGMRMVSEEMPDPIATEFRQVFEEHRFGLPFEDALLGLSDRVDLVDVRIFITAVLIQREVGGNLAEILDKISQTVRGRFTLKRQLKVFTAQGRISGYALVALPVVTASAIYVIDPEYVSMLWTESVGRLMVAGVLLMWFVGFVWIRRIIDIEI